MTLLELLRQELPKRGGWPEGADYCVQHAHDLGFCWVIFGKGIISRTSANAEGMWEMNYNFSHDMDFCANELARDHATAIVTREQYEATSWDGTGLPPVGMEIEYKFAKANYRTDFSRGKVLAYGIHNVFMEHWASKNEFIQPLDKIEFRPLRTEAERAIDEMVRLSGVSTGAAKILYDAGYRK